VGTKGMQEREGEGRVRGVNSPHPRCCKGERESLIAMAAYAAPVKESREDDWNAIFGMEASQPLAAAGWSRRLHLDEREGGTEWGRVA